MRKQMVLAALLPLLAGGCVAKTAWNVATLPVKAAGAGVDAVTTSPKERDEKFVRQQRKAYEREQKERRAHAEDCRRHPDCGPYTGFVANAYPAAS